MLKIIVLENVFLLYMKYPFQAYEGLSYKLSLEFPSGYPYKAPKVKFETPCWHPNVDQSGNICLDILKEKWSALYDVRTILLSVQSLLEGNFFIKVYVIVVDLLEVLRESLQKLPYFSLVSEIFQLKVNSTSSL